MFKKLTFGSVCSGIEAAQLAFKPFGFKQLWSSEIAEFPSKVLHHHYPSIPNIGDMNNLPSLILQQKYEAPDLFCGGTPCQAFSLAGWKNGLADKRGQLTMTFIDIANAIDEIRKKTNKENCIILWENVEGVLNNRTNAFGNFIAGLVGYEEAIKVKKWSKAGFLKGKNRNVAWRVLDAKYFGLPQQRKRLYVLAGGKTFNPEEILFEVDKKDITRSIKSSTAISLKQNLFSQIEGIHKTNQRIFYKKNIKFEIFREYTDCLYSAYATKWNGNAAAYNGSLYVAQNNRIRRFTPLECERLMGFPDNYTLVNGNSDTNRYHAIGNSWAIPVVKWIGQRIFEFKKKKLPNRLDNLIKIARTTSNNLNVDLYLLNGVQQIGVRKFLNTSSIPNSPTYGVLKDIVQTKHIPKKFYLSAKACKGILRRKNERKIRMNEKLEQLMQITSTEINRIKTVKNLVQIQ